MDKEAFKVQFRDKLHPLVLILDRTGFTPTSVSVLGLVISILAGYVVAKGHLFWGAVVFLVGSGFDMLDGALARLQGTVSRRGAFLDSTFDRFGEAALFGGMTWFYMTQLTDPRPVTVLFILGTVVGSLTTSYVRARAEGIGETCYVGLLQRPERIVLLVLGMILGWRVLEVVLAGLALATLATTVQRIVHVIRKLPAAEPTRDSSDDATSSGPHNPGENT
jgi:CDP-diacylglycerol--glycerol-3-phosphate 3-phosphatidyltransferase